MALPTIDALPVRPVDVYRLGRLAADVVRIAYRKRADDDAVRRPAVVVESVEPGLDVPAHRVPEAEPDPVISGTVSGILLARCVEKRIVVGDGVHHLRHVCYPVAPLLTPVVAPIVVLRPPYA